MSVSPSPSHPPEPGELRTDFLGRVVVLTPARSQRPHEHAPAPAPKTTPPAQCLFCPGNEHLTPPELDRVGGPESASWSARAFPNKFPAFSRTGGPYGCHEVMVETPEHGATLSQLADAQLAQYLGLLVRRLRQHAKDKKVKYTAVFKNEGAEAGASLEHTHTQLVGMPLVPEPIKRTAKLCKSSCPFCLLSVDDKFKKIISDGPFLALAPHAPRFNNEVWVVPRSHTPGLSDLDEPSLASLASVLGKTLRAQDAVMGYAPYNLLFYLAPHGNKDFHFRIELCPRPPRSKWAGFEFGSDVVMNSVRPEWTAAWYKEQMRVG